MIVPALCWIDWKLAPGAMAREAAGRCFLLFLLVGFFAALLLSGGMNRFLSERWPVTAFLRLAVSAEEGQGIAGKAAVLPGVLSAAYRDPETSWKEFLEAYPGMEPLRAAGGNPLPGYVEIRMRPEKFTEGGIRAVEAALRPLPQVDRILSGGAALSRMLRVKEWVNALLWGGFALLCLFVFTIFLLQEKARASLRSTDLEFLRERGVPARSIAASRAAGAMLACLLLSLAAVGAAVSVLYLLETRFPIFVRVIGRPRDLASLPFLLPAVMFLTASALGSGAASLLGGRAAQSGRK